MSRSKNVSQGTGMDEGGRDRGRAVIYLDLPSHKVGTRPGWQPINPITPEEILWMEDTLQSYIYFSSYIRCLL